MAKKHNLVMDQGSTFVKSVDIESEDDLALTDYTCRASMRKHHGANSAFTFSCEIVDDTTLTLSMSHANTALIEDGNYVYDVEIVSSSNTVTRVLEGLMIVTPEVTKT